MMQDYKKVQGTTPPAQKKMHPFTLALGTALLVALTIFAALSAVVAFFWGMIAFIAAGLWLAALGLGFGTVAVGVGIWCFVDVYGDAKRARANGK